MNGFDEDERELSEALDRGEINQKEYHSELKSLRAQARDDMRYEMEYGINGMYWR